MGVFPGVVKVKLGTQRGVYSKSNLLKYLDEPKKFS